MAVLGEIAADHVVHRAAGIGAEDLHLGDGDAVGSACSRLDHVDDPAVDLGDHRTAQEGRRLEPDAPTGGGRHLERLLGSADAWSAQACTRADESVLTNRARSEAGQFLLGAPGLVLCDEIWPRAAGGEQRQDKTAEKYANTIGQHGTGTLSVVTLTRCEFPSCPTLEKPEVSGVFATPGCRRRGGTQTIR